MIKVSGECVYNSGFELRGLVGTPLALGGIILGPFSGRSCGLLIFILFCFAALGGFVIPLDFGLQRVEPLAGIMNLCIESASWILIFCFLLFLFLFFVVTR